VANIEAVPAGKYGKRRRKSSGYGKALQSALRKLKMWHGAVLGVAR
jgi:hypothetical protein